MAVWETILTPALKVSNEKNKVKWVLMAVVVYSNGQWDPVHVQSRMLEKMIDILLRVVSLKIE